MMNPENFLVESNGRLSINPEFKAEFTTILEAIKYFVDVLKACPVFLKENSAAQNSELLCIRDYDNFIIEVINKIFADFGGYDAFEQMPVCILVNRGINVHLEDLSYFCQNGWEKIFAYRLDVMYKRS